MFIIFHPLEVYSANILTKPEDAVSIFALFTERVWNNEFIYHVKPYCVCAVTSSTCVYSVVTSRWQRNGNDWLALPALQEAFKIVFVVFREYRGMSRRKMSSLENIEACLEGRYQKHEQVGNEYL